MKLSYNVTGQERKSLVGAISSALNAPTKYLGMPTAAYEVGGYTIDKVGTVTGSDDEGLANTLRNAGFDCGAIIDEKAETTEQRTYQAEISDPDCPDRMEVFSADNDEDAVSQAREFCTGEAVLLELFELDDDYNAIRGIDLSEHSTSLTIEYPLDKMGPAAIDNLTKMVAAKEALIKAALGADDVPIKMTADTLQFPWFAPSDPSHAAYYVQFVFALCKTAKEKKRVTAKAKEDVSNPKFSFRVWLVSLGMTGDEYKNCRKLLLSNLTGNSAFAGAESKERWAAKHTGAAKEAAANE
jgi:hypothetical protein